MSHIVILGTGLAGYTLAREIRKRNRDVTLTLITHDDGVFYSKPMLSTAQATGKTAQTLRNTEVAAMREELAAEILTHTQVIAIDRDGKRLQLADGQSRPYDKLVLAVGAQPIRVPLQGDAAESVLSVNNLEDYARFEARLAGVKRVALLGAGLIGCEFANDLIKSGRQVDVFDLAPQPLGRLLPEAAAHHLREALAAAGVRFHLGESISAVERAPAGLALTTTQCDTLEADLVLSAVGLRSDTTLAAQAGLAVNRGIVVNEYLQTDDESIYALGDCAEVCGAVLPYVMPIMNGARVLAANLLGEPQALKYPPMPVLVKTSLCPVVVCPPPAAGGWQEEVSDTGVLSRHHNAAGQLDGFALVGAATAQRAALLKEMQG
ncbi:MAG: hypothetical protein RIR70_814 [Pseudomonadota bacterium]|jgi:rubredoxin-NAD+ reductase